MEGDAPGGPEGALQEKVESAKYKVQSEVESEALKLTLYF
jgi:hypothetical protein